MAQPLTVALPPGLDLWGGCRIKIKCVDPSTGLPVTGVTISDIAFEVATDNAGELDYGPFMLVTGPQG